MKKMMWKIRNYYRGEMHARYSEAAVNTIPVGSASASLRLTLLNNERPFLATH